MKNALVISLSFVFAFILEVVPMSWLINWMRPEWVLLTLIYWVLVLPDRVGISIAFILGLLMDLVSGALLGEHALAFVAISYMMTYFSQRIRLLSMIQQMIFMFLLLFAYQTFQFWTWKISGIGVGDVTVSKGLYWLASVTSVLVWPIIYTFLKYYQNRYKVY